VLFLWNYGSCRTKIPEEKKSSAAQEAKALVKKCKGKKWTPNRGSNGTPNQESSNFAQFQMFSQYEEYQKFRKSQKKAVGKRNRNSDNSNESDNNFFYFNCACTKLIQTHDDLNRPGATIPGANREGLSSLVSRRSSVLVSTGP
jgi:hypothetical protein